MLRPDAGVDDADDHVLADGPTGSTRSPEAAGAREPESEALRQLQSRLPSAYTVFHGVHWSREYRSGPKFGELDFMVVNKGGKALATG